MIVPRVGKFIFADFIYFLTLPNLNAVITGILQHIIKMSQVYNKVLANLIPSGLNKNEKVELSINELENLLKEAIKNENLTHKYMKTLFEEKAALGLIQIEDDFEIPLIGFNHTKNKSTFGHLNTPLIIKFVDGGVNIKIGKFELRKNIITVKTAIIACVDGAPKVVNVSVPAPPAVFVDICQGYSLVFRGRDLSFSVIDDYNGDELMVYEHGKYVRVNLPANIYYQADFENNGVDIYLSM